MVGLNFTRMAFMLKIVTLVGTQKCWLVAGWIPTIQMFLNVIFLLDFCLWCQGQKSTNRQIQQQTRELDGKLQNNYIIFWHATLKKDTRWVKSRHWLFTRAPVVWLDNSCKISHGTVGEINIYLIVYCLNKDKFGWRSKLSGTRNSINQF